MWLTAGCHRGCSSSQLVATKPKRSWMPFGWNKIRWDRPDLVRSCSAAPEQPGNVHLKTGKLDVLAWAQVSRQLWSPRSQPESHLSRQCHRFILVVLDNDKTSITNTAIDTLFEETFNAKQFGSRASWEGLGTANCMMEAFTSPKRRMSVCVDCKQLVSQTQKCASSLHDVLLARGDRGSDGLVHRIPAKWPQPCEDCKSVTELGSKPVSLKQSRQHQVGSPRPSLPAEAGFLSRGVATWRSAIVGAEGPCPSGSGHLVASVTQVWGPSEGDPTWWCPTLAMNMACAYFWSRSRCFGLLRQDLNMWCANLVQPSSDQADLGTLRDPTSCCSVCFMRHKFGARVGVILFDGTQHLQSGYGVFFSKRA